MNFSMSISIERPVTVKNPNAAWRSGLQRGVLVGTLWPRDGEAAGGCGGGKEVGNGGSWQERGFFGRR